MDPLYLRKLRIEQQLNGQQMNNSAQNTKEDVARSGQTQNEQNVQPHEEHQEVSQQPTLSSQSEKLMNDLREDALSPKHFKMNYLASLERSNYIKKVMNLPNTLPELLIQLQKPELAKNIKNVLIPPMPEPNSKNPQENIIPEDHSKNIVPNNKIPDPHHGGKIRPHTHIRPGDNKIPNISPGNSPAENIDINTLNKPEIIINKNIIQMQYDDRFNHRIHGHNKHRKPPEIPPPKTINNDTAATANLYANLAMNDIQNPTLTQMRQRLSDDAIELLFTGLINLKELSKTIKENGHDARSKLIIAMAAATKHGIDSSQISGTMKMISEHLATEENNPASILKNIIMLYLPWYPLQEGVGFNLSIDTMHGDSNYSSLLNVYIQTRNYGNVNGSLVLLSGNNVDMNIMCNDSFPQDELLDRMKDVTQNHSIQSNITIEERAQMANETTNQQAKVNMSSTYELNPFLLLMAHSFIKNTIIIDSGASA